MTITQERETAEKIGKWISGQINPLKTNGVLPSWARKYLLEIAKYKCQRCGWCEANQFTGKVPLVQEWK